MPTPIYERRAREACALMQGGLSRLAASRRVGIAYGTLGNYLKTRIKPARDEKPPVYPETVDRSECNKLNEAMRLRAIRFSYRKISELLEINLRTVYKWRDNGVFREIERQHE